MTTTQSQTYKKAELISGEVPVPQSNLKMGMGHWAWEKQIFMLGCAKTWGEWLTCKN